MESVQTSRWPLTAILVLALAVRVAAAIFIPDQSGLLFDAAGYRQAAQELLARGMFGSPYIMPFYPLLVLVSGGGIGQLAADIALSVGIVGLVYALSLQLFAQPTAALFAALWTALYPPLIFIAVVGLSETLFIATMLASFLCWYRGQMFVASVFAVLTILTRPVFDLAGLLLTLYFCAVMLQLPWRKSAAALAVYVIVYCVLMAPWWWHNEARYGQFVRLNLGFGTTLYAGNNPMNVTGGGNVGEDYKLTDFMQIADPVAQDRAIRDAAIVYMKENPGRTLELAALKFMRMWRLWPRNEGYASAGHIALALVSIVPVLLLTLAYLAIWGWRERWLISPILLFSGYYVTVHMVLVGTIRYRLPLEPFMIMFASIALMRLAGIVPFAKDRLRA